MRKNFEKHYEWILGKITYVHLLNSDQLSKMHFSRNFLFVLGGLIAAYLIVAIIIDPRGYFHVGQFPVVTLDSRAQKIDKYVQSGAHNTFDGLILGSSRSMGIDPKELRKWTGKNCFNFSVDSACAEDYLAIYRWSHKQNPRIKLLFIGLDIEALHNDDRFDSRLIGNRQLANSISEFLGGNFIGFISGRGAAIYSRQYAQDVYASIRVALVTRGNANFRNTNAFSNFDETGLIHYVEWEKQVAAGVFKNEAHINGSVDEYRRRFEGMSSLSKRRCLILETLLKEALEDGVTVRLWITPIHPKVASFLSRKTSYARLLDQTRIYIGSLRQSDYLMTFDFSAPVFFGGNDIDWWDGAHVNPNNASRLALAAAVGL